MFKAMSFQINRALDSQTIDGCGFWRKDKMLQAASILSIVLLLYLHKSRKYQLPPFEFRKFGIKNYH